MRGKLGLIWGAAGTVALLWGCNPVTTHNVASTLLDGAPSVTPTEQMCKEYREKSTQAHDAPLAKIVPDVKEPRSTHRPYREKMCDSCHENGAAAALSKPARELCLPCHPGIVKRAFVHGPVAVGECLDCHEPHTAEEPALLKVEKGKLCLTCHTERRVAERMHAKLASTGMACTACHDPHGGNAKYFLR
jgi:predicted CXXCH cytochrome family protein